MSEQRTVLYDRHVALGARMAPFGGYAMPIQYEGIIAEHGATRERATIFDTCHMGELHLQGASALADLERLVTCRLHDLPAGRCRYGLMCSPEGGVVDDLLVYRFGPDEFMLVVNAGTREQDVDWVRSHLSAGTVLEDRSETTAKLDLQGPAAPGIAAALLDAPIGQMRFYSFAPNAFGGAAVLTSRTGYTGEIGFEFYTDHGQALDLWDACLEKGAAPAGLGARDTLRLEMGMPLYGHELGRDRNAAQSGFTRAIDGDKEFVGCEAVRGPGGDEEKLVGIAFEGRRAARPGEQLVDSAGAAAGTITSGSFGPSVGKAIALAYVGRTQAAEGTQLAVPGKRKERVGTVSKLPFYRGGTARSPMSDHVNGTEGEEGEP